MKQVSILGCGWLGKALAKTLLEKKYPIRGSVQTAEKSNALKAIGISPYVIRLENFGVVGDLKSFVADTDILITAFPPGIRRNPETDYVARINHVLNSIPSHSNCNILHLSSIGVFGASQGNVIETDSPKPENNVGKQLLEAEKAVMRLGRNASVVRLGGLLGDGRHPVRQLAGKSNVAAPLAPTNLVHQSDVVSFLTAIIEKNLWGEIFHCVSPLHQQRGVFYKQECVDNGLTPPDFSSEKTNRTKKVMDTKSAPLFDFVYELPECRFKDC
jgi:nucleoside-diphosphate-sugar epimerase